MTRKDEPTTKQVEAAAGFLRDNLHLFGPQACFLETGHIDEIWEDLGASSGWPQHLCLGDGPAPG